MEIGKDKKNRIVRIRKKRYSTKTRLESLREA